MLVSPWVVAVADGAFPDPGALRADFADRAELRFADLSRPTSIPAATDGVDALVVTLQRMQAEEIAAFSATVRVIGRAGVGLDSIDLAAARAAGVAVVNQPAYAAAEVASHAMALLLALQRRLLSSDRHVRSGWPGPPALGVMRSLDELTVGVLGCGRIGTLFAQYVRPLVREVVVHDPDAIGTPSFARRFDDLDEFLSRSDILSVHVPLTASTRGFLGGRELELLPPGALVINVARGGLLDEGALAELLTAGRLGGAGLDVFEREPLPQDSPLISAPNTVFSPHSASVSVRSLHRLSRWSVGDVLDFLDTGTVQHGAIVVSGADVPSGTGASG